MMHRTIQFLSLKGLTLALALMCCVGLQAQPSSQSDGSFWVPDGPVQALAETNGILYIGGGFNHVRPVTGRFVPIHRETGEIAGPFEQIFGTIDMAIPDGNGGWFVGGIFSAVGSVPRTNLVHILADRTVDPAWALVPNGRVTSGVLTGGRLFIGGEFTEINGQPRSCLAALNPQTAELLPLNLNLNGTVRSMAAGDSFLYLGGRFTTVMGQSRGRVAALDLSNNQLADWRADADTLVDFGVTMLSLAGGRLYVAGDFRTIGSSNRNGVAALDPGTAQVLPWNPNLSGTVPVAAVAVRSNLVYLAGRFGNVGGVFRPLVAAVDSETGALANWGPTFEVGELFAMALVGNTVYVGGRFNFGPDYLAAIDVVTGQFLAWDPSPGGDVKLIVPVPEGDLLYIGGDFGTFGGVARKNLAALDSVTGVPTAWNPVVDGSVFSLALEGDALYVGGAFGSVGGIQRTGLCAISVSSGSVLPFDARLGFGANVTTLAVGGSNLFAGGSFSTAGNIPAGGFAVLDRQTGQTTGWTPSPTGSISAFAVSGGQLYLSGTFTNLNGQTRTRLASFDLGTRQLTDWQPTLDTPANILFASASQLFLSGSFTRVNGRTQLRLASLDVETGQLNAWNPPVPSALLSMTTLGATFYGVGTGGLRRSIDTVDGHTAVWDSTFLRDGLQPNLQCVLGTTRGLFVGGAFSDVNGQFRPWLARFPVTNLPPFVKLLAPTNSTTLHLPAMMELQAHAADDGSVQEIEYYVNGNVVAVATQPPFSASWSPAVISNYVITAVAVDNVGERGLSLSAHVAAVPAINDVLPTVQLTTPQEGTVIRQGSPVVLSANASDSDSRLVGVQFFLKTNLVAFITNAPYATVLSNLAQGAYTATARAVDEFGVTATNGPIGFRVNIFPTVSWVSPPAGTQVPFGTNLFLSANASDSDGVVRSVSFFSGTNLLAATTNSPFTFTVSNLTLGNYIFTADAVDDLGSHGVSPPLNILVYPLSVLTTLVNSNSTWKYLDDGSNQGQLWRTNTYNDTGWSNGVAQLGFGDGDEVTLVRSNRTDLTRIVTTYFRKHFNVGEPSLYFNLVLRLKRDDGGVVYLNGLEVFRSNMTNAPGIPVLFSDLALNATDEVSFFSTTAPASLLRPGDNLVAVEIHQTTLTSSDISFDLQLQAESGPLLFISQSGGMVTLSWLPAVRGLELQRAPTPSGPWTPAPDQVNNPQSIMTSPMDAPTFWRLLVP